MFWLKLIGWAFVILPILAFLGFAAWMVVEVQKEDENVKAVVVVAAAAWFIGLGILFLTYFTDFADRIF